VPEDYPVNERIVQAVQTALQAITTANGYATNVTGVVRPRRTGEGAGPQHGQIRIEEGDDERDSDSDLCGNPPRLGWRLPLVLALVVRLSTRSEQPLDQALRLFVADVIKCVAADCTWGGLAWNTDLAGVSYLGEADGIEGATVALEILYRTPEDDPYTATP